MKEVDLAIMADLETLQRLSGIVGFGNAMELALTGRRFLGSKAKEIGLVSKVFESKEAMEEGIKIVAEGFKDSAKSSHNQNLVVHSESGPPYTGDVDLTLTLLDSILILAD
ncbi:hypothetical protein ACH5RR_037792 [Cinchona calisaya]|uniref:Uncharacterized protein n=1 Tax=Cinchona calisaya TaxID=153742 RepID=A0ABD2YCQ2_9GENT